MSVSQSTTTAVTAITSAIPATITTASTPPLVNNWLAEYPEPNDQWFLRAQDDNGRDYVIVTVTKTEMTTTTVATTTTATTTTAPICPSCPDTIDCPVCPGCPGCPACPTCPTSPNGPFLVITSLLGFATGVLATLLMGLYIYIAGSSPAKFGQPPAAAARPRPDAAATAGQAGRELLRRALGRDPMRADEVGLREFIEARLNAEFGAKK